MLSNAKFAAVITALFLAGCGNRVTTASASSMGISTASTTTSSATVSNAIRQQPVTDPSLDNMAAATYNLPAKWHFQSTLMQASPCLPVPSAVFRATSPDGLSFVEDLPTYAWIWGTGPAAKVKHDGCLPLNTAMGAQDFLKYISATLNVEYVADEAVPADVNAKTQKFVADQKARDAQFYANLRMPAPENTVELARAGVRYRNGSFVMRGRLDVGVNCTAKFHKGMKSILRGMPDSPDWTESNCFAQVRLCAAPENQYPATISMLDAINIGPETNPEWAQARRKRMFDQSAQAMKQFGEAAAAAQQARNQQFAHDQAVRQQMHENFLANMQRGTDMSMRRAAEVANSNHRMAQDVVDYALDRQTVLNPATGQVSKVSSAYTYTWVDNTGKTSFQTNDVTANPNGSLQGNWTRQQVVHGDGSQ